MLHGRYCIVCYLGELFCISKLEDELNFLAQENQPHGMQKCVFQPLECKNVF